MSHSLTYDEIKFDKEVKLEDISNIRNDTDSGFFVECDLSHPDKIKEETKVFLLCPEKNYSRR